MLSIQAVCGLPRLRAPGIVFLHYLFSPGNSQQRISGVLPSEARRADSGEAVLGKTADSGDGALCMAASPFSASKVWRNAVSSPYSGPLNDFSVSRQLILLRYQG